MHVSEVEDIDSISCSGQTIRLSSAMPRVSEPACPGGWGGGHVNLFHEGWMKIQEFVDPKIRVAGSAHFLEFQLRLLL